MEIDAPVSSGPATGPARAGRRVDLSVCLALGLIGLLVYNANLRVVSSGDNYPARYLPFAILGYGTLRLDPIHDVVFQGRTQPYWVIMGTNGRLVSQYPVVTPLLVSPLYLPAVAYLHVRGWTNERMDRLARLMEKLSASLIASLSVALVYLLLRRQVDVRTAVLLSVAYGFGTNTWMIGSQGLWQHGMGELLLVIALLLVTGPFTAGRALAVGVVCALIVFNRPPDAILVAGVGSYGLWRAGRRAGLVAVAAAVAGGFLLAYNKGMVGNWLGGYAIAESAEFFRGSMAQGIAGLLFSPGRGLFVFSPFLIALPFGLRRALGNRGNRALSVLICIAVVLQVALYAKIDWRGGSAWGPRYLTDALPLLIWLLAPVVAGMGCAWRGMFALGVCVSVGIQTVGAFWYTGASDEAMYSTSGDPARANAVWNLVSTPFLYELRHPMASHDLLLKVVGGIDSTKAGGVETQQVAAGTPVVVEGWTLANDRRPTVVVVRLDPGPDLPWSDKVQYPLARVKAFLPRPDISNPVHPNALAGWRVVLNTSGLPPGAYMIEVSAQGGVGGEYRPVAGRALRVAEGK